MEKVCRTPTFVSQFEYYALFKLQRCVFLFTSRIRGMSVLKCRLTALADCLLRALHVEVSEKNHSLFFGVVF